MKKVVPFSLLLLFFIFPGFSQLPSCTHDFIQESTTPVVIIMDATKVNHVLLNYTPTTDVYVPTCVIANKSTLSTNWLQVKFNQNFNQPNPALQATYPEIINGNLLSQVIFVIIMC